MTWWSPPGGSPATPCLPMTSPRCSKEDYQIGSNVSSQTLRILRPEGVMIWSQKTAQAEQSTEFGLFEQNLTSLVKAGKCTMVKHEVFCDNRNKTVGELYVVRRLAGR